MSIHVTHEVAPEVFHFPSAGGPPPGLSLFCLAASDDEAMKQNPNHRKFTDRNWDLWKFHQVHRFQKKKKDHQSPFIYLVGGFNPFEKYARQIGNVPQSSG